MKRYDYDLCPVGCAVVSPKHGIGIVTYNEDGNIRVTFDKCMEFYKLWAEGNDLEVYNNTGVVRIIKLEIKETWVVEHGHSDLPLPFFDTEEEANSWAVGKTMVSIKSSPIVRIVIRKYL